MKRAHDGTFRHRKKGTGTWLASLLPDFLQVRSEPGALKKGPGTSLRSEPGPFFAIPPLTPRPYACYNT